MAEQITPPTATPHVPSVDALRGVAILLVFVGHSVLRLAGDARAVALGLSGVSLFFVISGFCIHLSASKMIARQGVGWAFLRDFMRRRFWRIYPPYLLALVAFAWMQARKGEGSLADFGWHAALLHNWLSGSFFSINPAFWSIAVEWQFYLLYPLLALAGERWGRVRAILGAALISLLCRWLATLHQRWQIPIEIVWWNATPVLLFDWLVGVWMAEHWMQRRSAGRAWRYAPGLLPVAWGLVFCMPDKAPLAFPLLSLAFGGVLTWALARNSPPSLLVRGLETVGLCSYSLYLWHQPLLGYVQYHVEKSGWAFTGGFGRAAEYVLVVFPVLLAWSWLAYRFIERPCMALGHRRG